MKNSKKLLSLLLAVVMLASVFTVMAVAAPFTTGPAVDGNINIKYTVEKVDTVPATDAGSEEYTADNIYAVTVWGQNQYGIDTFNAPVHFDQTLFAPITLAAEGTTFPNGAGLGPDDYYTGMDSDAALYAYSFGDCMNNTGMYKADGSKATTKALAKCIGLGNANATAIGLTAEYVTSDHPNYGTWSAGLPANTGIVFAQLDVSVTAKSAYLNTVDGITPTAEYVRMFTFYFETLPGVTDADVVGAEFGCYTADCFGVDGTTDEYAGYYTAEATSIHANPAKNVVSNAVIEKAAAPELKISQFKDQVRYNEETFDYRVVYQIDNFSEIFTNGLADASNRIIDAGFIFSNDADFDVEQAKASVKTWKYTDDTKSSIQFETVYKSFVKRCYISTTFTGADYAFACLVKDIPNSVGEGTDANLYALGYIIYEDAEGNTAYAFNNYTLDVDALYKANKA